MAAHRYSSATLVLFINFCIFSLVLCQEESIKILDDLSFEHLTQASTGATTGDWLVLFSRPDFDACPDCKKLDEVFDNLYQRYKGRINVAKLWTTENSLTRRRFNIKGVPEIFMFHHGRQFKYVNQEASEELIVKFVEGDFKNVPSQPTLQPLSQMDILVEELLEELRHLIMYKKRVCIVIFIAGIFFGIMTASLWSSVMSYFINTFNEDEKFKEEDDENEDAEEKKEEEEEGQGEEKKTR